MQSMQRNRARPDIGPHATESQKPRTLCCVTVQDVHALSVVICVETPVFAPRDAFRATLFSGMHCAQVLRHRCCLSSQTPGLQPLRVHGRRSDAGVARCELQSCLLAASSSSTCTAGLCTRCECCECCECMLSHPSRPHLFVCSTSCFKTTVFFLRDVTVRQRYRAMFSAIMLPHVEHIAGRCAL